MSAGPQQPAEVAIVTLIDGLSLHRSSPVSLSYLSPQNAGPSMKNKYTEKCGFINLPDGF